MKTKTFTFKVLFLFSILLATGYSCSDYLDVQPEDKLLESQIYGTEAGINSVLNGVYLNLAGPELYGGNLTMTALEVLAQRYNITNPNSKYTGLANYNFNEINSKMDFEAIWSKAYEAILNLNDLIDNVDKYNTLIPFKANIIKGEAYGLRAMLHFDLLRLFGPVYSENPDRQSIPYYSKVEVQNGVIQSASTIMDLIIEDLEIAEAFLAEDSIKQGLIRTTDDTFYEFRRNLRINYFAVKALQARVHLYAGNKVEANSIAKKVIDEASEFFPWTHYSDIITVGLDPDRVFSSELIFAIQNVELYQRHREYFDGDLLDYLILAPNNKRLIDVFENNENDYRYNTTWILPAGSKTYKTFNKYADTQYPSMEFRYLQPIIRISEMYYILAETETDPTIAIGYLNTVRQNRGLVDLNPDANIDAELLKEYQKEFYGEGQLFFYYKRRNISNIPDGNTQSESTISMGVDQYVAPLPDSETRYQ